MRNESEIAGVFHCHAHGEISTPIQEGSRTISATISLRDPGEARDAITSNIEQVMLNVNHYTCR